MNGTLVCWRCGASLNSLTLPIQRADECSQCSVQIHVCKMCVAYSPRLAGACVEDRAEEVQNKEQANFCDYFKPASDAYSVTNSTCATTVGSELGALFDDDVDFRDSNAAKTPDALDSLFKS